MIRNVEDEGDVGGLDRVGRFRGDGGGEDSEGVGFDEGVEGGDVGFGVGGADIAVSQGLKQGEQIIVGSYQALRSLRSGARVRVEKSPPATS